MKRVFVVSNAGIHHIDKDLKSQYGEDIVIVPVTQGNIDLNQEVNIAKKTRDLTEDYYGAEFAVVPSGLPYITTVIYNTLLQITGRHPVYLQFDREAGRYIEKVLDPRKLIFS